MIVTPIHPTRLCCGSSKYHEYVFVAAPCLAGASTPQSIYLFLLILLCGAERRRVLSLCQLLAALHPAHLGTCTLAKFFWHRTLANGLFRTRLFDHLLELSALIELQHDVRTSNKLTVHVELRDSRPA